MTEKSCYASKTSVSAKRCSRRLAHWGGTLAARGRHRGVRLESICRGVLVGFLLYFSYCLSAGRPVFPGALRSVVRTRRMYSTSYAPMHLGIVKMTVPSSLPPVPSRARSLSGMMPPAVVL